MLKEKRRRRSDFEVLTSDPTRLKQLVSCFHAPLKLHQNEQQCREVLHSTLLQGLLSNKASFLVLIYIAMYIYIIRYMIFSFRYCTLCVVSWICHWFLYISCKLDNFFNVIFGILFFIHFLKIIWIEAGWRNVVPFKNMKRNFLSMASVVMDVGSPCFSRSNNIYFFFWCQIDFFRYDVKVWIKIKCRK